MPIYQWAEWVEWLYSFHGNVTRTVPLLKFRRLVYIANEKCTNERAPEWAKLCVVFV